MGIALKDLNMRPEHGYGSSTNVQKVANELEREARLKQRRREKYFRILQQIHARHQNEKKY